MPSRPHKEQLGKVSSKISDCSQIENGEEEETDKKESRWKCNGLRMKSCKRSLNEKELKEVLFRRKPCKRYFSWQYMNVCCKIKKVNGLEEKKSERMSSEEMKNKPSSSAAEDSEEIIAWRTMSQEEMDQCWKKLAEKTEEEAFLTHKRWTTAKEELSEAEALCWDGGVREKVGSTEYESGEKIDGR